MQNKRRYAEYRILGLLHEECMDAETLSVSLGEDKDFIDKLVDGRKKMDEPTIARICHCFDITVEEFWERDSIRMDLVRVIDRDLKCLSEDDLLLIVNLVRKIKWAAEKPPKWKESILCLDAY